MRKAERARLTWAGYDRETGVVRLPGKDAKTGEPRRIVLAGPLQAVIARRVEARKAHPECSLIFHRERHPVVMATRGSHGSGARVSARRSPCASAAKVAPIRKPA